MKWLSTSGNRQRKSRKPRIPSHQLPLVHLTQGRESQSLHVGRTVASLLALSTEWVLCCPSDLCPLASAKISDNKREIRLQGIGRWPMHIAFIKEEAGGPIIT